MSREIPHSIYTQRITLLRDFIAEVHPKKFDMATWGHGHGCRTPACIGGWASRIFGFAQDQIAFCSFPHEEALVAAHLGLTKDQSEALFYPLAYMERNYTPEEAVAVLDHYLETGHIDWSIVD